MKKVLTAAVIALASATPLSALAAQPDPYVSGSLGVVFLNDSTVSNGFASVETEFDAGFGVTAAVGMAVDMARAEVEYAYRSNDIDKFTAGTLSVTGDGDITSSSLMFNGYYDFKTQSPWTPFIGVGLGFSTVEIDDATAVGIALGSEDDTVFAYQVMAGLGYAINQNLTIDASYRYFATSDVEIGGGVEAEYESHNFMVGARYSF